MRCRLKGPVVSVFAVLLAGSLLAGNSLATDGKAAEKTPERTASKSATSAGSAAPSTAGGSKVAPVAVAKAAPVATPVIPNRNARWPRSGEVRYIVQYGENGIQLGTSLHRWDIRPDGNYRMTALTEPTGIAALSFLKVDAIHWLSEGRMTAAGFAPQHFVERRGTKVLNVQFDPGAGKVFITDHEEVMPPGMQDVMTLFYQLGHPAGGIGPSGLVSVTSGYRVEQYHLERVGEQWISLPAGGTWRTVLLRARSEEETAEIWLAADRYGLPVQIRKTEKGGQKFTLRAAEVKVTDDALDLTTH